MLIRKSSHAERSRRRLIRPVAGSVACAYDCDGLVEQTMRAERKALWKSWNSATLGPSPLWEFRS